MIPTGATSTDAAGFPHSLGAPVPSDAALSPGRADATPPASAPHAVVGAPDAAARGAPAYPAGNVLCILTRMDIHRALLSFCPGSRLSLLTMQK